MLSATMARGEMLKKALRLVRPHSFLASLAGQGHSEKIDTVDRVLPKDQFSRLRFRRQTDTRVL